MGGDQQWEPMDKRVEEVEKSECRSVMDRIGTECSDLKGADFQLVLNHEEAAILVLSRKVRIDDGSGTHH